MKRSLKNFPNGEKIKLKDGIQTNKVDNTRVNYTPTFSKKPFTPESWATNINEIQPDGRPNPNVPGLGDATLDALMLIDPALALGKLGLKLPRLAINTVDRNFLKVGKELKSIEKAGKKAGLSDHEIAKKQMEEVGITSNQRQAYIPKVSESLEKYVTPYGYTGSGNRQTKLAETWENIKAGGANERLNKNTGLFERQYVDNPREDAWNLYLGLPQKGGTFKISDTSPSLHSSYGKGQFKGKDIYNVNYEKELNHIPGTFSNKLEYDKYISQLNKGKPFIDRDSKVMGGYNKRFTNEGLQYNDVWDLNPDINLARLVKPDNEKVYNFLNKFNIDVPVDKFIGKPFLSHGNIPEATLEKSSQKLFENLKNNVRLKDEQKEVIFNNLEDKMIKYKNGGTIKRSLKKYTEGGDITGSTQLGSMAGQAILGAIPDKQMTDMNGNPIGTYETRGEAIGKGALKGASTGAMIGSVIPGVGTAVGAGVGALVGGVGSYINNNKERDELAKVQKGLNNNIMTKRRLGNINTSVNTIQTNDGNMYPHGGVVTTDQPGAIAELELEEQMQLPNGNVMGVSGPSHEEGGVEVNVPEGTRVFSDRLKLGKKTFANHAKTINNKIAKLDNKPTSSAKTNTEMLFNKQLDNLFNAQEEMKAIKEQKRSFKNGGVIPAHNVTLMKNGGLVHYSGVDGDPSVVQPFWGKAFAKGAQSVYGDVGKSALTGSVGGVDPVNDTQGFNFSPQNAAFATTGLSNIIQNQQLNKVSRPRVLNSVNFTPGDRPDNVNFSNERAAIDSEIAGARRGIQLGSGSYSTQAANLQKLRNQQLMAKGRSFQTEGNTNTQIGNAYKAQQATAYNQGVQANLGIDQYNLENQYNYDLWKTGNKMKATGAMGDNMVNLFNNQTSFNNQMKYWDVVKGGYSGNIGAEIDKSMKKKNGGTIRTLKKK